MRKIIALIAILLCTARLQAQTTNVEKVFAFKITDYLKPVNDTVTIVQVVLPDAWPVAIADKQFGVLKHSFKQGIELDTALIGWGRCQLIKGDYNYFGIHLYKNQQASEKDLLYTKMTVPVQYDGLLLNVMKHGIELTRVTDERFMMFNDVFSNSKQQELAVLDSMVADIRYTGNVMKVQMANQEPQIKGGIYDGKKLFDAMQAVNRPELEQFLKYIIARPTKYAGHTWKISETFATWMVSETPRVVGN